MHSVVVISIFQFPLAKTSYIQYKVALKHKRCYSVIQWKKINEVEYINVILFNPFQLFSLLNSSYSWISTHKKIITIYLVSLKTLVLMKSKKHSKKQQLSIILIKNDEIKISFRLSMKRMVYLLMSKSANNTTPIAKVVLDDLAVQGEVLVVEILVDFLEEVLISVI